MTDTELLHRVAEAMKERAAITADSLHYPDATGISASIRRAIRAIDTAALVKEVCGHD